MKPGLQASQFVVRGRVQGVGFRAATRRAADRLKLRGSVGNQPDGSVLVLAAGPAHGLDALEEWLRHGPPLARVDTLERCEIVVDNLPMGFEITQVE